MIAKRPRHARRRRPRFALMESLGFYEQTTAAKPARATAVVVPNQPSPPPVVDPFDGWTPTTFGRQLTSGRVRWSQVVGVIMMCAGIAGIAAWLYLRPTELAANAIAEVRAKAVALQPSLTALAAINGRGTPESLGSPSAIDALLEVDRHARALFQAAGSLIDEQEQSRAVAADAAAGAIAAARILADTIAYRDALLPVITAPALETDPELVELDAAAFAYGEWHARFETVRDSLPVGVLDDVTTRLGMVAAESKQIQARYLDSLRSDDAMGAQAAILDLATLLDAVDVELSAAIAQNQEKAATRIADAIALIESLLG